jgi:hypothetical protein
MIRRIISILILCPLIQTALGQSDVRFGQDIRPILSKKCFQCHGPDEQNRKAGLRLDVTNTDDGAFRTRKGSKAIHPGAPDKSALWERISTDDQDDVMPPPEAKKEALTTEEKSLIKRWIEQGAEYEAFWAFSPPVARSLPTLDHSERSNQPIDRFIGQRLEKEGISPQPTASKRTLIRRLSFDLTGLPPTPFEIQNFVEDPSDQAYENLVDRLLAKPQYGEHMAKYWLDLVRFADTNGLHHDHYREMTPYRDWIIRAFNDNLSFDQFITFQVAGDLFEKPSIDQQIASGFNRLHLIIDRGTALPEESFTRNVIDRVTSVGTAFLGLTVQCAVCHDHKYDPITQKDFYQLFAFFNNFDGGPETGGRSGTDFKRGLQPPYIEFPSHEQSAQRGQLNKAISLLEKEIETLKDAEDDKDKEDPKLKALNGELRKQKKSRDIIEETIPATLVMKEKEEARQAHILIRGVYDQHGDEVERNTPSFLPPLSKQSDKASRMDLARWLTGESNPLTARVTVNRFWQQLFGVGIVKTSEDFGVQGELPSHPELLDYLTISFVESNWDVKQLLRSFVLSETYQQSSKSSTEQYTSDPENRLLARGPRFRLDSEMIRDQIIAVSGQLNETLFGKSVKPPQPAKLWETVAMPSSYPRVYEEDEGERIYRRSVYTFWKRALPPPQMSIFDAPTREACIARRERTNTPLQALLLMNESQYFQAAGHTAQKILQSSNEDIEERISTAYEMITSQLPDSGEMASLKAALTDFQELYSQDAEASRQLTAHLKGPSAGDVKQAELAAWTMLIHSLFNLDVTKTRQ